MRLASLFVLIFALSACGTVSIKDDPWCSDAGKFGAWCFNTISDQEFYLNKYEWDKRRIGQVCTATDRPGEGYRNIKVPLEKLCADSGRCTPEQKALLKKVTEKAENAISEGSSGKPF